MCKRIVIVCLLILFAFALNAQLVLQKSWQDSLCCVDSVFKQPLKLHRKSDTLIVVQSINGGVQSWNYNLVTGQLMSHDRCSIPTLLTATSNLNRGYFFAVQDSLLGFTILDSSDSTVQLNVSFQNSCTISDLFSFSDEETTYLVALSSGADTLWCWERNHGQWLSNVAQSFLIPVSYTRHTDLICRYLGEGILALLVPGLPIYTLSLNGVNSSTWINQLPLPMDSQSVGFVMLMEENPCFVVLQGSDSLKLYNFNSAQLSWELTHVYKLPSSLNVCSDCVSEIQCFSVGDEIYITVSLGQSVLSLLRLYDATLPQYPLQEIVRYELGFEAAEGFSSTDNYRYSTAFTYGPDTTEWSMVRASVANVQVIAGSQSLMMRLPNSAASVDPVAVQCYDIYHVTRIGFTAYAYPAANVMLRLECSVDGGLSFPYVLDYALNSSHQRYDMTLPVEQDSVRVRFTMLRQNEFSSVAVIGIDSLCFYGV